MRNYNSATISADPTAPYVSIYCSRMHESKPLFLATFRPEPAVDSDGALGAHWFESTTGYQTDQSSTLIPLRGHCGEYMAGDERVPREQAAARYAEITRSSFTFNCTTCGLRRSTNQKTLFPILDNLRHAGRKEVSLQSVAAMM